MKDQSFRDRIFYGLVLAAIGLGLVGRLVVGWDAPLWLDETYTGSIAIQPTISGLVQDCLNEVGGPVYYMFIWAWTQTFGASNVMLRIPSFIFAVAAPLVILWKGHPDKRVRATWAAIVALWMPGFFHATEARSYTLLFLLGSIQIILFCRLLREGNRRHACAWAALSALFVLTHTHALLQTGLQGLVFLAVYRKRALPLWPALLLLAPVALFLLFRLSLLLQFANPSTNWMRLLNLRQLLWIPDYVLGTREIGLYVAAVVLGTSIWAVWRLARGSAPPCYRKEDLLAALTSLLSIAILVALGYVTPSFALRYLIPAIPGALFGMALWAQSWGRASPMPACLIAIYLILGIAEIRLQLSDPKLDIRRGYNWQDASQFLASHGVQRLVFVWDNPVATGADRTRLGRVGAFFLHRAGRPVEGDAVNLGTGTDEQFQRAIFARTTPYALQTIGVITLGRKIDLSKVDARWTCRIYGGPEAAYDADVHTTACIKPAEGTRPPMP